MNVLGYHASLEAEEGGAEGETPHAGKEWSFHSVIQLLSKNKTLHYHTRRRCRILHK